MKAQWLCRSLGLAMTVMFLVSACAPAVSPTPQTIVEQVVVTALPQVVEGPKGTLTIGVPSVVETLDPALATEVMQENAAATPYETLTFLDGATGEVKPLLAESWDVVDPTTYVFHLRHGVKFHNGEPFNADAVTATFDFMKADETGTRIWAWETVKSVEKVDEFTVKITTKAPDPVILKRLALYLAPIYPPKYVAQVGADGLANNPVGTGPFKFKEWVAGEKVVYEANPDYWGRPDIARVEFVVWKSIPEASSRVAALEAGEIDIATAVPPGQIGILMDHPNLIVSRALGTRIFYVLFDNISSGKGTPLEDKRVRQALIYAIDRQAIVDTVFQGQGKVLSSFIGPTQFGYDPTLAPLPYDPEKAQQLLTEAGYPNGFKTSIAVPSGAYANDVQAGQAIVGYLSKVLDITLNVREANTHWDLECAHQFDPMFFDGSGDRFGDPSYPVNLIMITDNNCWATWDSPEQQRLLKQAAEIVDPAQREKIYHEVARLMQEDPPGIALWQVYNFVGMNKRVSGFAPWPTESMSMRGVSVAD